MELICPVTSNSYVESKLVWPIAILSENTAVGLKVWPNEPVDVAEPLMLPAISKFPLPVILPPS